MAVDEALLEFGREMEPPVLRFYSWSEAAASFGFSQKFSDVSQLTSLRPLVRRPTGGGLVPHDRDWTYSLVFPPSAEWYCLKAVKSYERVHAWLDAAFRKVGVVSHLAAESQRTAPGECFVGAEQFDVLVDGRKIAGAAQRRNKCGLLIQGSVQPPPGVERSDWESALCAIATAQWDVQWEPFEGPAEWYARVRELVAMKYSRREYNERR
jgi:lipoate-protein ligase A